MKVTPVSARPKLDERRCKAIGSCVEACPQQAIELRGFRFWVLNHVHAVLAHPDRSVAMAVVVQVMVAAEWAGVLFTADPVTGRRDRMVVEAVAGLGEALVSGQASGARYGVDKATLRLLDGDSLVPRPALEALARLAACRRERGTEPTRL